MKLIKIALSAVVMTSCYTPQKIARNVDCEQDAKEVVFLLAQKFPSIKTLETQTIVFPSQTYFTKPKVEFAVNDREIDSVLLWVNRLREDSTTLHNSLSKARWVITRSFKESVLKSLNEASTDSLSFSPKFIGDSLVLNVKFITPDVKKEVTSIGIKNAEPKPFYEDVWFILFLVVTLVLVLVLYLFSKND